jgi:hypothetical protein
VKWRNLATAWRGLFRVAEPDAQAHIPLPTKEEPVDHKASVAALLGSAAGAAEALNDCGVETDEAEFAANFIDTITRMHGIFVQMAVAAGVPDGAMFDTIRLSMQASPAGTNCLMLFRLAHCLKTMANREVLDAARKVVSARAAIVRLGNDATDDLGTARDMLEIRIAELAAVLPREA